MLKPPSHEVGIDFYGREMECALRGMFCNSLTPKHTLHHKLPIPIEKHTFLIFHKHRPNNNLDTDQNHIVAVKRKPFKSIKMKKVGEKLTFLQLHSCNSLGKSFAIISSNNFMIN